MTDRARVCCLVRGVAGVATGSLENRLVAVGPAVHEAVTQELFCVGVFPKLSNEGFQNISLDLI